MFRFASLHSDTYVTVQDIIDWPSLSLKWPVDRVGPELLTHLRSIPLERVAEMKRRLEAAACYFDYHAGWGPEPAGQGQWARWGTDVAALGGDCTYRGHGEPETPQACQDSCDRDGECNLINYRAPSGGASPGDCILRRCADAAQPALTVAPAGQGWEVWARPPATAYGCSPYAAIGKGQMGSALTGHCKF